MVELMARIRPFTALRYDVPDLAAVVAPPYDVISPEQRAELLARSPYNVVHLTLPDSEEQAAHDLAAWRESGVLVEDAEPSFWWLAQEYVGPDGVERTREGFVAALHVEPYAARVVLPHERTHAGPKEGRLRLLRATRTHLEPIFLLWDGSLAIDGLGEPDLFADESGVTSRLWRLDPEFGTALTEELQDAQLLIADGHHRYETALAFHDEDGSEASAYTFAVLVNSRAAGLAIFPTHRVAGRLPELNGDLRVTPVSGGPDEALRMLEGLTREHPAFVLYRNGSAALVEAPGERLLDAALVDRLGPQEVSYTPRAEEAVRLVDAGEAQGAFLLRPPLIEQVEAVAAAGETMPQKSTYFYPKLVSGLLFHPL